MLRAVARGATVLAGVLLTVAWLAALRPVSLGGPTQYVVVHGSSMLPTYHDGDLVITHRQDAYAHGDIVAYRVPPGSPGAGLVVLHRISAGDGSAGFVLQGDNNHAADPWHPTSGDIVGSTWVRIPRAGRLLALLRTPAVAAAVAAVAVTLAIVRGGGRRRVRTGHVRVLSAAGPRLAGNPAGAARDQGELTPRCR